MNNLLKSMFYLGLGLALALGGPAAAAQSAPGAGEEAVSGRELLDGCEANRVDGRPNQYCMRYVFGLVQTVLMLQQMDESGQQLFCIDPEKVSLEKVTADVTAWLQNAGDRLDEDAYVLVSEALNAKYPCGRV